jgi:hypothetical protein
MLETGIALDFVVVDGGEGGTGAAPLEYTDHVGAPLREALMLVHNTLVGAGLRGSVRVGASGKMITAFDIVRTMAVGADWCNSARLPVRTRLHPGADLPHGAVPDRRDDSGPGADARPGRARQGGARPKLPRQHAEGRQGSCSARRV